ncbi:LANO_0E15346g1_1 [Lachancea nothofagi CBS 11611]|uniref:Clathrin light chain n=1 Tax=Lachancea nothofagi CBS 11611 TaxID=1266666 RepID=A0A1G4K0Z1_9SACH|nr:LANO_0E15346g1_1 [Lachancea nothofagi CBS 11611]
MSEKFPPLENENFESEAGASQEETDFLKREAELLGDEFKTEQDSEFLQDEDDDEFGNFEEVPAVSQSNAAANKTQDDEMSEESQTIETQHSKDEASSPTDSKAVSNWREARDREVSERDVAQGEAKTKLQDDAVKHMDDFYDNYNRKKEQQLNTSRSDAEKFLKERDGFLAQKNTTWDRVLQLINVDDADLVNGRDRSKFKEILVKLKGNPNAPGA